MPYPAKLTAEHILEAALTLFQIGGSEALSMRLLAERLGVRPSSLYHDYSDRDALLGALKDLTVRDQHAAVCGAAPVARSCV